MNSNSSDVTFVKQTNTVSVSTMDLVPGEQISGKTHVGSRQHNWVKIGFIIFTWVIFVGTLVVNGLASAGSLGGTKNATTGAISNKYYIEITPQGWTFGVCWATIYTWLVLQLVYITISVFRTGLYGGYLYVSPPLVTPVFLVALSLNLVFNSLWLILWARELILVCLFIILAAAVTVYVALGSNIWQVAKYEDEMEDGSLDKDVWMVRVFIQNGLGFYSAWLTIATLLNLAIVIAYKGKVDQSIACTTSLVILGAELASWFILDNFVITRFTRYIITPYITAMIALAGSLDKNFDAKKPNSVNTAALFAIACLGLLFKLFIIFFVPVIKKKLQNRINDKTV